MATLPKGTEPDTLAIERAVEILAAKLEKSGGKPAAGRKGKAPAKAKGAAAVDAKPKAAKAKAAKPKAAKSKAAKSKTGAKGKTPARAKTAKPAAIAGD